MTISFCLAYLIEDLELDNLLCEIQIKGKTRTRAKQE